MDEIITVIKDPFIATLKLKNGTILEQPAIAEHTHWKSGRRDCSITIEKPLVNIATKEK